jgi:hypothetical protein
MTEKEFKESEEYKKTTEYALVKLGNAVSKFKSEVKDVMAPIIEFLDEYPIIYYMLIVIASFYFVISFYLTVLKILS